MSGEKFLIFFLCFTVTHSYLGWRRRRSSCNSVTGSWSKWTQWSKCTCTNNVPSKTRYRYCTDPAPSCGGRVCHGDSRESASCLDLAVHGGWGGWGPWTGCRCQVVGELKTRERKCDSPAPSCGGRTCEGAASYSEKCAVDGGWTGWGNWTACQCDHKTGTGTRSRTRTCTNPVPSCLGKKCVGDSVEVTPCNDQCCKTVDGGWTIWGNWSKCQCDHKTGTGTKNRTRTCTNPAPSCFGRSCTGDKVETASCDDQCCTTVDGKWSVWGAWSETCNCDHMTGEGHYVRSRTCSNPPPSCFGQKCVGDATEFKVCSEHCCKLVDGSWSVWGDWSSTCKCDHVTGTGHLSRTRACSNPPPDCGGKVCAGNSTETKDCSVNCCKSVHGGLTAWGNWSECDCDHSTGTGTKNRTRTCTNPVPSCFGRKCEGTVLETTACDEDCCKTVDGGWTHWGNWSVCNCDHSAGTGTKNRTRTCTNPVPSCFGRKCEGDLVAIGVCNELCCRTMNGGWTNWGNWSACQCDIKTETGTKNKTRNCTNPVPSCYGSNCTGNSTEVLACNEKCGVCDPLLCKEGSTSTCNPDTCLGYLNNSTNSAVIGDECGVNEVTIVGFCLPMYALGIIGAVLVLLAVLSVGILIRRRRRSRESEVPYVIENEHRIEREVVDEGVLTLSDTDVRYRSPCCEDYGDYQIFTNQLFADENDYTEQQKKQKNRLSAYVSTYNTVDLNRPKGNRVSEPGPSSLPYENESGPSSLPHVKTQELGFPSYENQSKSSSSYENPVRPRSSSQKTHDTVRGQVNAKHDNSTETYHYDEVAGTGPAYENQQNPVTVHYEDMSSNPTEVAEDEEHHYSEIRGTVGMYSKRDNANRTDNDNSAERCKEEEDPEYVDDDHIYFNPDLDRI